MAKNGDAPTIPLLNVAPSNMAMILSSGVRTPKDRLPDILISASAIKNTAMPRQHICAASRFLPSPNILIKKSKINYKGLTFTSGTLFKPAWF